MTTILIVDDDPLVLVALKHLLEKEGYSVLTASSGGEGIKAFRECVPDLVVSDILMPAMDGIETIKEIRRLDPTQSIIAMSGGGRLEDNDLLGSVENLLDVTSVTKPIQRDNFLTTISRVLAS